MSEHPSFLELDTYAVQRTGAPGLVRHLESCERCAGHLAKLRRPESLPDWVQALPPRRRRFSLPGWLIPMGAVALAAGLLLVVAPAGEPPVIDGTPAWAAKGTPEAQILVKRGETISRWSEGDRLATGDQLRVELHPSGLAHYVVVSAEKGGFSTLARGELRADSGLIPGAWKVDANGGEERLIIVLSSGPLAAAQLEEAVATLPRTAEVWTVERRLPKQEAP